MSNQQIQLSPDDQKFLATLFAQFKEPVRSQQGQTQEITLSAISNLCQQLLQYKMTIDRLRAEIETLKGKDKKAPKS